MVANKAKLLVPYIRQSKAKEKTISLDDQRRSIKAWAEGAGVKLAPEIVEQGVSGSKSWKERELGRAVEACQRGEASGIVVAFQDRLSRENGSATAEVWEALGQAEARFVCTSEGLDTATGDHEMLFTIKAAIAREQWKRHRLNWENGRRDAVERGVVIGPAPTGYVKLGKGLGLRKVEADCERIRAAYLRRAAGGSWTEVASELVGVTRASGEVAWTHGGARRLVMSPIYKGLVKSDEFEKFVSGYAVVSPSEWEAAQPVKGETKGPQHSGKYLLAKMLKCGHCETKSLTGVEYGKYGYYRNGNCPLEKDGGCPRVRVGMAEAEAFVVGAFFARLDAGLDLAEMGEDVDVERVSELEQAVTDAKARRRSAAVALDPSDAEDQAVLDGLVAEVEMASAALAEYVGSATGKYGVDPEDIREAFAGDAPVDVKRNVLRQAVAFVTVTGTKKDGPIETRAVITWVDGSTTGPSPVGGEG